MNTKRKILIINDDEGLREIFQLYLELKGYEIYQAEDGRTGIEQAVQIQPDLILLDVMMPGMDGYETCKTLKKDEKTKEIPVIFLSSLLDSSDKTKGLECGGVDFVTNTADQGEILARVETHLKIRALTQEIMASNKELMQKQKILNENLQAAAMIQRSLFPGKQPIPNVRIAWLCEASEMVGGDICNLIQIDKEHIVFYVLDVSGHGVPSAMVTVSISQLLQEKNHPLASAPSPKQMLGILNREYPFEKFNMFSTIFYMVLNPQNGKFVYSSAGHPPPVLLRPNQKFKLLDYAGAIVGLNSSFEYEERQEVLQSGDKLVLYTDGVIEFRNAQKNLYGSERFYALLESAKNEPIEVIVQMVMKALKEFGGDYPPQDDVTILIIEFKQE